MKTFFDGGRGDNDVRSISGLAKKRVEQISLLNFGWQAGGRSTPLHIHHHQWKFRHDSKAEEFGFQGHARTGSDGDCSLTSIGNTKRESCRRNFILSLMHHSTRRFDDFGEVVGDRGCWSDRIHGTDLNACCHHPHADGFVPIHDHLLHLGFYNRDMVLEIQVRTRPEITGVEQAEIAVDNSLFFVTEGVADLILCTLQVAVIDETKHAKHPHVLPQLRIFHDFLAFLVHRNFAYVIPEGLEILHGLSVFGLDFFKRTILPFVFQKDECSFPVGVLVNPSIKHLFVEGNHQIGLVPHVCYHVCPDTNTVSRYSCTRPRRGFDFGWNDFHCPDSIAHLG